MKLIIQNNRIIATATDDYIGPDLSIDAPEGFDPANMDRYTYVDGQLVLSVPQVITIRQAKLALLQADLLDDVEAAISQADRAVQIEWEYATEFRRDWPALLAMQPSLGLSDEQVDSLFVLAASL